MTNERSPALSYPEDPISGREPVLKGVGSRLLADRRGAYLTENVNALVDMLDNAQRLRYQQWCIRVCIRKAWRALPTFAEIYPDDDRPERAIRAAEKWLHQPNEANAYSARRAGIAAGYAGLNHQHGDALRLMQARRAALAAKFTALTACVTVPDLHIQVVSVAARFAEIGPFVTTISSDAAKRAQVRAAYTILSNS